MQWRRSKVIEMRVRGMSQAEIARELQVSKASISLDMQYLRSQAKGSIKEYVTEHLNNIRCVSYSVRYYTQNTPLRYCRYQTIIEKRCKQWNYSKPLLLSSWSYCQTLQPLIAHYTVRTKQQQGDQQQKKHLTLNSTDSDNIHDRDSHLITTGRQTVL